MSRIVSASLLVALAATPSVLAAETMRTDAVCYDDHGLIIDGKARPIFSGSFHYFRCPKKLWRDRFRKIKEAGFNAVETYVPWNVHETEKPPGGLKDFSKIDLTDLTDWMRMAHEEFDLYTIIRPGPYICAEWQAGGYPRWLLAEIPEKVPNRPSWLRSDDSRYLDWSQHWMDAVCKVVAPEQVTRKPAGGKGVILFQIENEYDYWGMPEKAKVAHLKRLRHDARAAGIEVPLFTCLTAQTRESKDKELADVFDAVNLYNRNDIDGASKHTATTKRAQPGKPGMVAELQGGWFAKVGGGKLSEEQDGIDDLQINAITLAAIANGAGITNYYMLFGGTHFGPMAGRHQPASYDYNAPIRETGAVGTRYAVVKGIGAMLAAWGDTFSAASPVIVKQKTGGEDIDFTVRATPAGERLVFAFNHDRKAGRAGEAALTLADGMTLKIDYKLAPFGYKVCRLTSGETDTTGKKWLPEPGELPKRPDPASLPPPVRITTATAHDGIELAGAPVPFKDGVSLAHLGVYEAFPVAYTAKVILSPDEVGKLTGLGVELFKDDRVVARVNGVTLATNSTASKHLQEFPVRGLLRPGENTVELLHEDLDSDNWNYPMQDLYGVKSARLTRHAAAKNLADWTSRPVADETEGRRLAATADDGKGSPFTLDASTLSELAGVHQPGADTAKLAAAKIIFGKRAVALFRTTVVLNDEELKSGLTRFVFERVDERAELFVNGKPAGKHADWNTPFPADAAALLHPGKNDIAVLIANDVGDGGLTKPVRLESAGDSGEKRLALSLARTVTGKIPAGTGRIVALDATTPVPDRGAAHPVEKPRASLTRYVAEFNLPKTPEGVWIPWHARINASGNGRVYLNGHHIGRYWQAGPQRAFYLPECWLKPGAKNTLLIEQLPTAAGAELRAIEIVPAAAQAEVR